MKMRVFDTYLFNIADKVSFGQTKPYLEQMMEDLGIEYSSLGFSLHTVMGDPVFDSVLQMFPSLKKYYYTEDFDGAPDPYLSSYSENWRDGGIHADEEDWDDISALFSKIPRSFSIPFGNLILDGVKWYEDSDDSIAVDHRIVQGKHPTLNRPPFKSNRILQVRDFDDGQKYNTIKVCIEATDEPTPRSTADIIKKLKPYLGEPKWSHRRCIFEREDQERFQELAEVHTKRLQALASEFLPAAVHVPMPGKGQMILHLADKRILKKVFADTCFELQKTPNPRDNVFTYKDEHNFRYKITAYRNPAFNEFQLELQITGCNFSIGFSESYGVTQGEESLNILNAFAAFCSKVLDEYSVELADDFGSTPAWY